ncbi:unnamed protein product [Oreochromis niloticus]|nr:unnamed protein product [Mustela putorius furo]
MDQQRITNMTIKLMVLALYCKGSLAEITRELSVLVGNEVTLSCMFDTPHKLVEWSALSIEWNMVDKHAKKSMVYTLEDGRAQVYKEGSVVNETCLRQSDASLQLHNVTVGDEGLYTCRVINPLIYTESTALKVLAQPSVLLPEKATVREGQEKTIQCDVTGFYPEKVAVMWLIQNGTQTIHAGLGQLSRVCNELAVHNPDGTYSIRSGITLHSSVLRGGEIHVICQVEHQTYNGLYNRSVTLAVQAPPELLHSTATVIAVTSVITLLLVTCVTGGSLYLYRYFYKVPFNVSEISQPIIIYAQVPTELMCTIQGSTRWELKVKWFKLRTSPDSVIQSESGSSDSLLETEDLSEQACLQSDGKNHTSVLPVFLTVTDDQTKYQCVVWCKDRSFRRETTVKVKGSPPDVMFIDHEPQCPKVNEECTLHLHIKDFCPEEVLVTWTKDGDRVVSGVFNTPPSLNVNGLYSMFSFLKLNPTKNDQGCTFKCQVVHSAQKEPEERIFIFPKLCLTDSC